MKSKKRFLAPLCLLAALSLLPACAPKALPANLPTPPPAVTNAPLAGESNAGQVANAPQQTKPASVAISTFKGSITRHVPPVDKSIQATDTDSLNQTGILGYGYNDLTNADISGNDYSGQTGMSTFPVVYNEKTVRPKALPPGFDPALFLENGKNRGLGIDSLHRQGITGKGVSIAMIGEPIVTDQREIVDNLTDYEEFATMTTDANLEATSMASMLVGATVGLCPDAKLYYIAASPATADAWNAMAGRPDWYNMAFDYTELTKAINRVVDIDSQLADADKISVLLINNYWFNDPSTPGYSDSMVAALKAEAAGIAVFSSSTLSDYAIDYFGLKRDLIEDPDDPANYNLSSDTRGAIDYNNHDLNVLMQSRLFVPQDNITLAGNTALDDYTYFNIGTNNQTLAYLTGLYALCCQVNPGLDPRLWYQTAMDTSCQLTVHNYGKDANEDWTVQHCVQPVALVQKLTP